MSKREPKLHKLLFGGNSSDFSLFEEAVGLCGVEEYYPAGSYKILNFDMGWKLFNNPSHLHSLPVSCVSEKFRCPSLNILSLYLQQ